MHQGIASTSQAVIAMAQASAPTNPVLAEALNNIVRRLRDIIV